MVSRRSVELFTLHYKEERKVVKVKVKVKVKEKVIAERRRRK